MSFTQHTQHTYNTHILLQPLRTARYSIRPTQHHAPGKGHSKVFFVIGIIIRIIMIIKIINALWNPPMSKICMILTLSVMNFYLGPKQTPWSGVHVVD